MSVGENIQKYRQALGLSQEALGEKLFVSRQSVDLWEKDQTVPTVENIMGLKDVLGISFDELLGGESDSMEAQPEPVETYRFRFSESEWKSVFWQTIRNAYGKAAIFALICVFFLAFSFVSPSPAWSGFLFGVLTVYLGSIVKGGYTFQKAWKKKSSVRCASAYEYRVFDDYILISVYRDGERVRESKMFFSDIEQIQVFGNFLAVVFGGQFFLLRKSELRENSVFYSYLYNHPEKTAVAPDKWRLISICLFTASLFSIFLALLLEGALSSVNQKFTENMWVFFLMTPIPIASTVTGFIMRKKGCRNYKKNIVAGIIMTVLLCIYGSFVFVF